MKKLLLVWIGLCLALASCGPRADALATTAPSALAPTAAPSAAPTAALAGAEIPWAPWPTHAWTTAAPEQVGMDSARLLTLLDLISKQNLNLHSLLVIRRGYLVLELNLYPYQTTTAQDLQSCTKSVTALLAGVALKTGRLKSIDQKVLDFFPNRTPANVDARKRAMTVRSLLTMTSGLNWPEASTSYASRDNPVRAMWGSPDPVQFVLDRPMAAEPGKVFNYNTGASQLLAAIIEQSTGQKLSEFAAQNLFDPLGIQTYTWHKMRGIEAGGAGLVLTPRNMAKLGYLYLRGGQWAGRQVVSAEWVSASTRVQVEADAQHGAYGYQWWVNSTDGSYSAFGFGGQVIHVFPKEDLVVVVGGAMNQTQRTTLHNLVDFFVLPAVVSNQTLAPVPAAAELLARAQAAAARPAARPLEPLPAAAQEMGGRSYTLESNPLNWQQFKLQFNGAEATLTVHLANGESHALAVGLDGVPRLDATLHTILSGSWDGERTFVLRYELLGDADGRTLRFEFAGREVHVTSTSFVQLDVAAFKGTAK